MKITVWDGMKQAQSLEGRIVIVSTDSDLPLMVGWQYQSGKAPWVPQYLMAHAQEPDFQQILQETGVAGRAAAIREMELKHGGQIILPR